MGLFSMPEWIKPHLYDGKTYDTLSEKDINELRNRLSFFSSENPDVSIMIPAWNEENNIFRTLSSLASNITKYKVEIVVINNNSSDRTKKLLQEIGVRNFLQPLQGTPFARQLGLEIARGKYHLCADSDTYYPPKWIDLMVQPMIDDQNIVGVYGRYSFIPPPGKSRALLVPYEVVTGALIRLRKINREHINVLGFNMGFVTQIGKITGGFKVTEVRKFDNALGSDYFVDEAEDGRMALNLKKKGKLKLITNPQARVFTSSRRLQAEGGIFQSFLNRFKLHTGRLKEYISGKKL